MNINNIEIVFEIKNLKNSEILNKFNIIDKQIEKICTSYEISLSISIIENNSQDNEVGKIYYYFESISLIHTMFLNDILNLLEEIKKKENIPFFEIPHSRILEKEYDVLSK